MEHDQVSRGSKIHVLIADNSQIHTQLLAAALRRDHALEIIAANGDSRGLVAAAVAHKIDVLVITPNLDEQPGRGFEILRELRGARPAVQAVVLLDSSKPEIVLEAFRSGARGVFSKNESIEALCKCVECVAQGQTWASSQELALALKALASSPTVRAINAHGLSLLTKRELEVVQCLAEGLTNREIAEHLGLSQHTVKNYLFRIFDKLGVSNRIELLFMSLSQDGNSQSVAGYSLQDFANAGVVDEATRGEFRKAAEQGAPMAQLALAQMHSAQRSNPPDLAEGYTWYLIAREQISRTLDSMRGLMQPEQIAEAERRLSDWLSKARKGPASSSPRKAGSPPDADFVAAARWAPGR